MGRARWAVAAVLTTALAACGTVEPVPGTGGLVRQVVQTDPITGVTTTGFEMQDIQLGHWYPARQTQGGNFVLTNEGEQRRRADVQHEFFYSRDHGSGGFGGRR